MEDIDFYLNNAVSQLLVLSNESKMKLFANFVDYLSDDLLDKEMKNQVKERLRTGDDVMFLQAFYELDKVQQKNITSIIKALKTANTLEELKDMVEPVLKSNKTK